MPLLSDVTSAITTTTRERKAKRQKNKKKARSENRYKLERNSSFDSKATDLRRRSKGGCYSQKSSMESLYGISLKPTE
eukprot:Awhi_evm1s12305